MFKLQNYTIRQRMYFIAMAGMAGVIAFCVIASLMHGVDMVLIACAIFFVSIQYAMAEFIGRHASKRAITLVEGIQMVNKGDLTSPVSIPGKGEFSWIAYEFDQSRRSLSSLVTEIVAGIDQLALTSQTLTEVGTQTNEGILKQQQETGHVASSVNEMAATVQEVARIPLKPQKLRAMQIKKPLRGNKPYRRPLSPSIPSQERWNAPLTPYNDWTATFTISAILSMSFAASPNKPIYWR